MQYNCYLIITTVQFCFCLLQKDAHISILKDQVQLHPVYQKKKKKKTTLKKAQRKLKMNWDSSLNLKTSYEHFLKISPFVLAFKVILKGTSTLASHFKET